MTKHAQTGTTWEDHSALEHSGFGAFCNPLCRALHPDAAFSLAYFTHKQKGSTMDWFRQRHMCLHRFKLQREQISPSVAFCATCTFTTADVIFNAQYHSLETTVQLPLKDYFTSRPQAGYWFPRCSFGRGCRKWNALACPEQVEVDFDAEKPRIPASRLATICVQAAAAAIWPDGYKVTPMGTFNFKPAMVHSHDVKRGVAVELPASGVVPIQTDLLGTADLFLLQTDRFVLTICLRVLHGRSQYH